MESKNKILKTGLLVLGGILLFAAGFGAGRVSGEWKLDDAVPASEQAEDAAGGDVTAAVSLEEPVVSHMELRVYDGKLQWFDGLRWKDGQLLETLMAADPFADALAQKEDETERRQDQEDGEEQEKGSGLTRSIGREEPEKKQPAQPARGNGGKSRTPEPEAEAPDSGSGESGSGSGSGNSGGGNSGGGNSGGGSGNSGSGNSGGGSGNSGSGNSEGGSGTGGGDTGGGSGSGGGNANPDTGGGDTPAPDSGGDPAPDTGDGENVEWSDDIL